MRRALAALAVVALAAPAVATTLLGDVAARQERAERVVRDVVAATLTGRPAAAAGRLDDLSARDARSLAPALRVVAATRPAMPGRLDHMDDALDEWDDPRADRLRAHFESEDPAMLAADLLGDERHDRWAAAVNDTLRPFGLGTNLLAVVNPVLLAGSAVDSLLSAAAHVRHRGRTSLREHEALVAYGAAAGAAPDGRLPRADARAARKLDARARRNACRRLAERAKDDWTAGRIDAAAYLVRSPAAAGCDDELDDLPDDVAETVRRRDAEREAARWPAKEPRLPRSEAEWGIYAAVAAAVVRADGPAMTLAAKRLAAGWPDGPNVPATRLVIAVAHALDGRADAARRDLEEIADDGGPGAAAARDRLAALSEADAAAVAAAERRHARGVAQYVLLGTGPSTRGVVHSAAHVGAQGAAGLPALGITNAIGILTRGFLAWRRDPAPNDTVIAEGESYLARHPAGREATDVRRRLVRAYERSRRWDRALLHYQALPDPDPEKIRDLEDEIADDMLERAAADPEDASLLRAVATLYPASDAAERARAIIAARDTGAGVPIPREVLAEVPWLLGATGLGLPAGLLDGDDENGELDDAGVRITPHAIECSVRGRDDEPATETIALSEADTPRVFATLEEIARIHRASRPAEGEEERGRWESWVPFFVQGTVSDAGVAVRPGIKLRPYEPAHPDRYR